MARAAGEYEERAHDQTEPDPLREGHAPAYRELLGERAFEEGSIGGGPGAAPMDPLKSVALDPHRPLRELTLLAVAELLAMTLWFSATAVLPALSAAWSLSATGAAWLTAAVQAGFVVGALASAALN